MKIAILSDELSSGMQMYLLLCDQHNVNVATEVDELLMLLESETYDLTFLDFNCSGLYSTRIKGADELMRQIFQKQPKVRLVGVCDENDIKGSFSDGRFLGYLTRPINSKKLLRLIQE